MYKGLALLLFTLRFLALSVSGEPCDSIEEGAIWNFRCHVQNFPQNIDFQLRRGDSFETVTSCNKQERCQTFNSNYSLHPESNEKAYRLEMKDVRRDENHFRCFVDGHKLLGECEFDVYVKPKKPTCDTPVLTSSGEMLSVTCKTDQVYPTAKCILSVAQQTFSGVSETYNDSQSPVKADDVSTECELQIAVSAFSAGPYQFKVKMYADVKDGEEKTSIESYLTDPIELRLPRVAIADDCPAGPGVKDGFITKGTKAICKCELSYAGSPPGHAQWYTNDDVVVGVMNQDGSATLQLAYEASDPRPTFECRGNSHLDRWGKRQSVHFAPVFVDDDDKGDNSIYLIVGMGVLAFVLVIVIIVAVNLYRRKKPSTRDTSTPVAYHRTCKTQMCATQDNVHKISQQPTYDEGQRDPAVAYIYDRPSIDHVYSLPM